MPANINNQRKRERHTFKLRRKRLKKSKMSISSANSGFFSRDIVLSLCTENRQASWRKKNICNCKSMPIVEQRAREKKRS